MKMARATIEEAEKVIEFLQKIEEKVKNYEDFPFDWIQHEFNQVCGWRRVVFGYMVLHDNCADQALDYLDFKPEIKAAMELYEKSQEE